MTIKEIKRNLRLAKRYGETDYISDFKKEVENFLDLFTPRKRKAVIALLARY